MLLLGIYFLALIYYSWNKPVLALILAMNAFIVNAILGNETGFQYNLIGVGGPLLFFMIVGIKKIILKESFYIPLNFEGKAVFLLFFFLLMSSLYAKDTDAALNVAFRYLFLCASFFYAVRFIISNQSIINIDKDINLLVFGFYIFGVFTAFYLLFYGVSSSEYVMRLTIGTASPIPISVLIGQAVIINFYYLIVEKNTVKFYFFASSLLFLLYAELLTNTRSTLLGISLIIIYILFFGKKSIGILGYKKIAYVVAFITPIIIGVFINSSDSFERLLSGFERLLTGEFGESEGDRLSAWLYAIEISSDNILLGIGAGNFGQYYIAYPHNIFFEILAENGIFALILLAMLLLNTMYLTFRSHSSFMVLISALFLYHLFISQVSFTLWMHKSLFLWLSVFMFYYINKRKL